MVCFYYSFRKKDKTPDNAGTVHWRFENQLYDDLYPNNVSLPPVANDQTNRSYANPLHSIDDGAPPGNFGAAGASPSPLHEKGAPKEWVVFDEDTKPPINDYIESQYGDPYNIEKMLDEPPEYKSRAGTPAPSDVSLTNLGDLPDYSSRVGTPGLPEILGDMPTNVPTGEHATVLRQESQPRQINVTGNTYC